MRIIVLCLFLIFGSHVQFTSTTQARRTGIKGKRGKIPDISKASKRDITSRSRGALHLRERLHQPDPGSAKAEMLQMNIRQFLVDENDRTFADTFAQCRLSRPSGESLRLRDAARRCRAAHRGVRLPLRSRTEDGSAFGACCATARRKKRLEMDLLESYRKLQHARQRPF